MGCFSFYLKDFSDLPIKYNMYHGRNVKIYIDTICCYFRVIPIKPFRHKPSIHFFNTH